jgi:hypothetical protein
MKTMSLRQTIGAVSILLGAGGVAQATENGQTHVDLAFIDQLAGVPLPPGFYTRLDTNYNYSDTLADRNGNPSSVNAGILGKYHLKFNSNITAEVVTAAYVAPFQVPFIHATIGTSIYAAYAVSRAEGQYITPLGTTGSGETRRGLDDFTVVPFFLSWAIPNTDTFVTVSPVEFTAPTGQYNRNDVLGNNIGFNYWSYRPAVTFTYLNNGGQELSLNANASFNSQNNATHYKSGDEFSVTYLLQQHFSRKFAAGIEGFYYRQVTADRQNGVEVNTVRSSNIFQPFDPLNQGPGNFGETFAFGPALTYQVKPWGSVNVHYEHEVYALDRARAEIFWLRGTFAF